jgi:hypothetical protein
MFANIMYWKFSVAFLAERRQTAWSLGEDFVYNSKSQTMICLENDFIVRQMVCQSIGDINRGVVFSRNCFKVAKDEVARSR